MQNIKPSQEKRFLKYYNKDAINSTVKDMKINNLKNISKMTGIKF